MNLLLTIGMSSYDDPVGLAFTLHSLMLHHAEAMPHCEIFVVDNHANKDVNQRTMSACAWLAASSQEVWDQEIKAGRRPEWMPLVGKITYRPYTDVQGTSYSREQIFLHAAAPNVACIDSHVILCPGFLEKLIDWLSFNPDEKWLVQGPVILDDHRNTAAIFADTWREKMWGTWESDPRADGTEPFDIPMQGLGFFACRRDDWLPFPPGLAGFGGEEGMLHEYWRQNGRRTVCIPDLKWWHLFRDKGAPAPYNSDIWDRIRNYVIWAQFLKMDMARIRDHFYGGGLVSKEDWEALMRDPIATRIPPSRPPAGSCGSCGGAKVAAPDDILSLEDLLFNVNNVQSDMHVHAPKLLELAKQCRHITEIGKKHEPTVVFLAAQPDRLVSYNHGLPSNGVLQALQKRSGRTDFIITHNDCMTGDAEATDMLFVDEIHRADRLWAQLEKFGTKTRRFIAFHDTALYAEAGQDNMPGLLPAIRRFVQTYPKWSVVYHTQELYGLTVLSCDPEDKKKLPSGPRMAFNYAKALAKHTLTGRKVLSEEQVMARLDVCSLCDQRSDNRCAVCGCFLDEGPNDMEGKALWADQDCPLAKWPKHEAT